MVKVVSDINGLWLRVGTGTVLAVDPDGTYLLTQDGDTLRPLDAGTVSVGGPGQGHGVVSFVSDGSGRCDIGDTWTWAGVTIALDLLRENDPRGTTMRASVDPLCTTSSGGGPWRLLAPDKFAAG